MKQPHIAQWSFVTALYAKPGIKDACLALQDAGGVDIPILLAAIYASAKRGIQLDHQALAEMEHLADPIRRDFIQPLRALRTALKDATSQVDGSALQILWTKILEAELCAEQEQLALVADYFESRPRAAAPDISATVELVCDFYFAKQQEHDKEMQQLKSLSRLFAPAASSVI